MPYSHHPYAYALSNPTNWSDPTGKYADDGFDPPPCPVAGQVRDEAGRCVFYKEYIYRESEWEPHGIASIPDWDTPEAFYTPNVFGPGGFDRTYVGPVQEIFVPTALGPNILIQLPHILGSNQEIFSECPDKSLLPDFVSSSKGGWRRWGRAQRRPEEKTYHIPGYDHLDALPGASPAMYAKGARLAAIAKSYYAWLQNPGTKDRTTIAAIEVQINGRQTIVVTVNGGPTSAAAKEIARAAASQGHRFVPGQSNADHAEETLYDTAHREGWHIDAIGVSNYQGPCWDRANRTSCTDRFTKDGFFDIYWDNRRVP